jgi:hypothetical protein
VILTACYRKLNYATVKDAAYTFLTVCSMVMFIIIGANIFNSVFLFMGGGDDQSMLLGLPYGRWFILGVMMFVLFIGGFFISGRASLHRRPDVSSSAAIRQLWFAIWCASIFKCLFDSLCLRVIFVKDRPMEITTKTFTSVVPLCAAVG